jgi:anti-sigma regulatory factor (Ser/Thr protein kinase)
MTHELRTPLNAIIGFSEALRDGLVAEFDALQTNLLDEIHRAGESLLGLVNRILDLSKLEAGKMTLQQDSVHVESLLHEAAASFQEACKARGIELVLHVAPDAPTEISGDAQRLKTVLQDLLDNALRVTAQGTIRLEAMAWHETGHHATAEAKPQSFVQIRCSDTGKGMTQDQLTRAFSAFESNQRPGLGLALAKGFTEAHGGTIHIESTLGQGTTVCLKLPCGKPMTAAPAVTQQMAQSHEAARVIRARQQDATPRRRAPQAIGNQVVESRPMPLWPWLAVLVACVWAVGGRGSDETLLVHRIASYILAFFVFWRAAGPWRLVGAGTLFWLLANIPLYVAGFVREPYLLPLSHLFDFLGYLLLVPGFLLIRPREWTGASTWAFFLCLAA